MKFKLDIHIEKPHADVWKAFNDIEGMKKWQPTLIKIEPLSGTQGQPGAVSRLTYKENGREFSLTERILLREESGQLDGVYENAFADNIVRNTFLEQEDGSTLWVIETEYTFKTVVMKILGPLMKSNFILRTRVDMGRFKELAESL